MLSIPLTGVILFTALAILSKLSKARIKKDEAIA